MMSDEQIRLHLEYAIEKKAQAFDLTTANADWLRVPEWDQFIDAWYKLIHYYEEQGDTVVGPFALGSYKDFTRLLRNILLSDEFNVQVHEQAEEALGALENIMDEIVRETMTNLLYHHPELNK
jgi:hypothetical protein